MGIIRAAAEAVGKSLADQWLEVIEADDMGARTVFTKGVKIREGQNRRGSEDVVSNGSLIHVYPNQFMMLIDGGKVVDYTAEEGYYKVDDSSMPSLFDGQFGEALRETFNRVRFGAGTPKKQIVCYVNLQEIRGIRFGTRNPVNYFDNFYNAELFLRAHGTYSIKITDPLKFYKEVIPKNTDHVEIDIINEQYLSEFLSALQSSINQMSAEGERISYVASKSRELGRYMADVLDSDWNQMRGMEIQAVGIASISYDEESQKLINMRNQGAMLGDPSVREGYVQGAVARGMEAAGSNTGGAVAGFMGMGAGINTGGGFMGVASEVNMRQRQKEQGRDDAAGITANAVQASRASEPRSHSDIGSDTWRCECGAINAGKFCSECGKPKSVISWTCECGAVNSGKFCSECGKPRPIGRWTCECGAGNMGKFCSECGKPRP